MVIKLSDAGDAGAKMETMIVEPSTLSLVAGSEGIVHSLHVVVEKVEVSLALGHQSFDVSEVNLCGIQFSGDAG